MPAGGRITFVRQETLVEEVGEWSEWLNIRRDIQFRIRMILARRRMKYGHESWRCQLVRVRRRGGRHDCPGTVSDPPFVFKLFVDGHRR